MSMRLPGSRAPLTPPRIPSDPARVEAEPLLVVSHRRAFPRVSLVRIPTHHHHLA
jgi:hypothetical protein